LYDPTATFPDFDQIDVRPLALNRSGILRRHHRLALPLLASGFSGLNVDADVAICSTSGWAHGANVTGRKVVYCHAPARWLYQRDRYLAGPSRAFAGPLSLITPSLLRWDRRAAESADRYLVNSHAVRSMVADIYDIDAEVVAPPVDFDRAGPIDPVEGIEPGFVLCVSRLLPYKNVESVASAFHLLPDQRLVIVGSGPLAHHIDAASPANVTLVGQVSDANLRWLYEGAVGLVAASYEDFGLTPVEAAVFGKPTAVLRWGGFLDTTVEGHTGVFFDEPKPHLIAEALDMMVRTRWSQATLVDHAAKFSVSRFADRIRELVAEVSLTA
jgi:glycosyltransferase involved in cell wall biosynthesis